MSYPYMNMSFMNMSFPLIGIALLLCATGATAAPSYLIVLDSNNLAFSRTQIAKKNPVYLSAYQALMVRANKALAHLPYSVMDKTLTGASGDKHDYYSFPPYWWPNPDKKKGLPYIHRDGKTNPSANSNATDKRRIHSFSQDVYHLALAYYFSGDMRYAQKAHSLLIVWFIDPATKMNPNMKYAQAVPGLNTGRGIGLIDGRVLVDVIDAVELLRPANILNETEYRAIKDWYNDFYHWMLSSRHGFEVDYSHNNHGTYFDLQAAAYAMFNNRSAEVKRRLLITQRRRIAEQFSLDGSQKTELGRPRAWHYSNFNLTAYSKLGMIGEKTNVDIWHFSHNDRSLEKGYRFIAHYINSNNVWNHRGSPAQDDWAIDNMLAAAHAYKDIIFQQKANYLINRYPNNINILTQPLRFEVVN